MRLLPLLIVMLAHAPLLFVYFQQLWSRPHYQFFPLVLGAAAYFMWQRRAARQPPVRRDLVVSSVLLLASAGLLGLSFLRLSPMVAYVSFVLAVGAILLRQGVPALGPWMLLLLIVRIPYGLDVALIQWMQRLTTQLSGTALESLGIEHIADGNVLLFPTTSLFVEEACSGVVSLLAIVACAGILAVWWRRALVHALLLIGAAVFLAGAMNVVRVVAIAIALDRYDVNLTEGWRHETVGLCIFAVSLLALFSLDRLLFFLLAPIEMNPLATYRDDVEGNIVVGFWNRYVGLDEFVPDTYDDLEPQPVRVSPAEPSWARATWDWAIAAACLVIAAGEVSAGIGPFSVAPEVSSVAMSLTAEALPEEWKEWKRAGFETLERDSSSAFGEHSRIWAFRRGPILVRVSLDFVFPEWHSLDACYRGVGWTAETSGKQRPDSDRAFVESTFTKPNGESAILMFDLFDDDGQPYEAPAGSFVHPKLRRIFNGESSRWNLPNYYQVQALSVTSFAQIEEDERTLIRNLFQWFRREMIEQVTATTSSPFSPPDEELGSGSDTSEPLRFGSAETAETE